MNKSGDNRQVIVAYVPVLHEGYIRFFNNHPDAEELFLIGPEIIKDYKPLVKDLRAIGADLMKKVIGSLNIFKSIEVVKYEDLKNLASISAQIIMPNEEVMRDLKETYFKGNQVIFDSIFLRWDKHKSFENRPIEADQTISENAKDQEIISLLRKEAEKSSDIWRQIGAAIVKKNQIISVLYNHAVPSEQLPYDEGDPRSDFSKGVNIDLSTSFHCEARLIAEAAQKGTSLEGTSLYVTTFPCPACAKLVAYSGIKEIYYADGYGVLDGERILKSRGVKIIHVKMNK